MSDLEFGLRMTVLGMGIVFGMLLLLWGLLALANRLEGGVTPGDAGAPEPGVAAVADASDQARSSDPAVLVEGAAGLDRALLAAITVAVIRHAEARRLQAAPEMRSYWPGSLLFASRWVAAGRMRQGQSWRRRPR